MEKKWGDTPSATLMSAPKKKLACRHQHCHEGLQNLYLYLVLMVFEQKWVFSSVT